MSCIDKILQRRSIRKYKKENVSENVKEKIIEAGRQAPSASNKQPWHFIIVTDKVLKEKLSVGKYAGFVKDADFVVVGVGLPSDPGYQRWSVVDVTIALQNMVIAAEVQGVGSCWIGSFDENEVKQLLGIPKEAIVVALMPFGIPDESPAQRPKKQLVEIIHNNRW
ncbi:MAG: nitroreductase family protein [Candidatus Bathyarchaeota archaeon]|nr:nitroreductase family protein [Candidatus Bathyarchaeota archaeon]